MYGGRPLGMFHTPCLIWTDDKLSLTFIDVRFNDRWHTFSPSAAKGGQVASMAEGV